MALSKQAAEAQHPSTVTPNPYFPPSDGRCLVNQLLPPELLAHIFLLGTAQYDPLEDEDEYDDDDDEDDEGPLFEVLVSHVCRLWRDIALNTPALWTRIDFDDEITPYEMSQVYLERSKNAPLDISIDVTKDMALDGAEQELRIHSEELDEMLGLVLPHVPHWRAIDISVSEYSVMHNALILMSQCPAAPMLEVLQLYHYEDPDEESETFSPAVFKEQKFVLFCGNAPKLQHVALWGVHLNWAESRFLSGLIDLELAYHPKDVRPSFNDFSRILRKSPGIDTLTLCQSGPAGGPVDWLTSIMEQPPDAKGKASSTVPSEPIASITLDSLKSFVIAYVEAEYATALAERLAMPNVTSLAIDFDEDADFNGFLTTITRPSPATDKSLLGGLEALKLSGIPCTDTALIADAYAAMTNLKSINLNFHFLSEPWHKLLAYGPTTPGSSTKPAVLLPRLEAMTTTGLDGRQVRHIVERRKDAGLTLKYLYMNEEDELEEEDEKWLKGNVAEFEYFEGSDEEDVIEIDIDEGDGWEDVEDDEESDGEEGEGGVEDEDDPME